MGNEPETDPVCEFYAVFSLYTSLVSLVGVWCHEEKLKVPSKSGFHYFSMATIIVLQILVLLFFYWRKKFHSIILC